MIGVKTLFCAVIYDFITSQINRLDGFQFRRFPPAAKANRGMFVTAYATPKDIGKAAAVEMEFRIGAARSLKLFAADDSPSVMDELTENHHRPLLHAA